MAELSALRVYAVLGSEISALAKDNEYLRERCKTLSRENENLEERCDYATGRRGDGFDAFREHSDELALVITHLLSASGVYDLTDLKIAALDAGLSV